jgi:hypothetical protein
MLVVWRCLRPSGSVLQGVQTHLPTVATSTKQQVVQPMQLLAAHVSCMLRAPRALPLQQRWLGHSSHSSHHQQQQSSSSSSAGAAAAAWSAAICRLQQAARQRQQQQL